MSPNSVVMGPCCVDFLAPGSRDLEKPVNGVAGRGEPSGREADVAAGWRFAPLPWREATKRLHCEHGPLREVAGSAEPGLGKDALSGIACVREARGCRPRDGVRERVPSSLVESC